MPLPMKKRPITKPSRCVLQTYVRGLIADLPTNETKGEYNLRISPREGLSEYELSQYYKFLWKQPLEFVSALNTMLPKDTEFVSFDHLANSLVLLVK